MKCTSCNGSGYYDHDDSPECGACDGTGEEQVSEWEFEELQAKNTKLCAEIERLKSEQHDKDLEFLEKHYNPLVEKNAELIDIHHRTLEEMAKLQLLVESHLSDLRICWDFLSQLDRGIMDDGDHVDTSVGLNASFVMEKLKARAALGESEK